MLTFCAAPTEGWCSFLEWSERPRRVSCVGLKLGMMFSRGACSMAAVLRPRRDDALSWSGVSERPRRDSCVELELGKTVS